MMHILLWILLAFKMCICYQDTLLFNTPKDIRIAYLTKPKKFAVIVKDLQDSFALDYLHNDSLICWTDHAVEQIDCVVFNSTYTGNRTTYAKNVVPKPEGLACDWLTRKLYWTDNESKRIEVVSLQTKYRKVLYWDDLEMPRGIALDPLEGVMFWTDWTDPPKIERGSMDGDLSSRKTIVSDENIYWPNSVTLNLEQKLLYWVDGKFGFIEVTDYEGKHRRKIADKVSDYPFALSLGDSRLYFSDWKNFAIYSIDYKTKSPSPSEIIHLTDTPIVDTKFYSESRQPYKWTPCEQNNAGCSHLCLLSSSSPQKYSCACPTGFKLVDNKNCANHFEQFLLLAERREISKISLDTPDHSSFKLPLHNIKHTMFIDYDPVDDYIYWTDPELQNIRRAKLDGSKQENVITSDVLGPEGIAVDWIARNIYWSDTIARRIEVFHLNSNYRKAIIFDDLGEPRAVVVSPLHGWLFWSDWYEKKPKIERSDLDGSNRLVIVKNDISWPNGLALDYENNKVYWSDAKTDKIEVIGMDGQNREEVFADNLPHVFGLSLLGDHLYWTDWQRRSLESVNVKSRQNRVVMLESSAMDVMGIKAVKWNANLGSNWCSKNNGDCSQFCFNKPANKYVCSCQVEYELDTDNKTCVMPEAFLVLHSNNRVLRMSIQNSFSQDMIPMTEIKSINALDVSIADRRLYWADNKMRTINRGYLNGSRNEKIVSFGIQSPEALAIDWLSSNLYWADTGHRRIEVTRSNSHYRKTLFWNDLYEPRNLVLDPREGYMFWSEWNHNSGSIIKAAMDGSSKRVIVSDIPRLNGLAIDYAQRCLYWTHGTSEQGSVERCDFNGQNRKLIVSTREQKPYSITQSRDSLFWTTWNDSVVVQANKQDGENRRTLHTQIEPISDMRIVDSTKQTGWNHCALNNGGCKYLCLVGPGITPHSTDVKCACPTHYIMEDRTCHPPDNFLLLSQRNAVYRLTTSSTECPDAPLPIPGLRGVSAIEYDSTTGDIYWMEKISTIKRSAENGSHTMTVVGGNHETNDQYSHFYDIALEPFSKLLFWSCSASNTINVTRLDNSSVGCVFKSENGEKPRSLALHPEKGLLFWSDVGSNSRIVQFRLNGDKPVTINTDSQIVDALTVDRRSNLLYFTYAGKIFQYNLAEQTKRHFASVGAKKMISVAVIQSFLYWTDKDAMRVERGRINVNMLSERSVVVEMPQVTDLIAVDRIDDTYQSHPCSSSNGHGNCSHLCMPASDSATQVECGCPLLFKLSEDRKTCFSQPQTACGPEHFMCKSGMGECIPFVWKCDTNVDCIDASDEDQCPERTDETPVVYNQGNLLKTDENSSTGNTTSVFAIAILVICLAFFVAYVVFHMKKKCIHSPVNEHEFAAMTPLAPGMCPQIGGKNCKPMGVVRSMNGSSDSYDRSHVTGVSSSTSMINCPLNPPPSPTTTTMHQEECDCMPYQLSGPTPTPCSTDVCDESDAMYQTDDFMSYRSGSRTSYHRRPADRVSRHRPARQARYHHRSNFEYKHEYAPPSTPHSWSDPPSPSLTPYAPPPTPINSPPLE